MTVFKNTAKGFEAVFSENILTVPNVLTFTRILLIIPFLFFFGCGRFTGAAVVLILSGVSDFLDGFIARKFGQTSKLGKYLDPFADKLTLFSVGFCVVLLYPRLVLFVALPAIKDAVMIVCSVILLQRSIEPPSARWFGKAATACFYCASISAVVAYYLSAEQLFIVYLLFSVSFVLMITAAIGYCKIFKDLLNKC